VSLRALRDADPARGTRYAHEAAGLYLDFSRQRIDDDGLRLLSSLADAAGLRARIEAMWRGEPINTTEGRAVLHTALRVPAASANGPGGEAIAQQVLAERERMLSFAESVRVGGVRGTGGARSRQPLARWSRGLSQVASLSPAVNRRQPDPATAPHGQQAKGVTQSAPSPVASARR